jgi:hypothetical protein
MTRDHGVQQAWLYIVSDIGICRHGNRTHPCIEATPHDDGLPTRDPKESNRLRVRSSAGTSIILVLILLARYQGLGQALVKAVPAADSGLRSVCPFSNHYRLDNEADTHRLNMSSQAASSLPAARLPLMLEVLDASLDAQRGKQFAPNRGIPSTLATARYTYKGTCFCVDHVQSATLAALAVKLELQNKRGCKQRRRKPVGPIAIAGGGHFCDSAGRRSTTAFFADDDSLLACVGMAESPAVAGSPQPSTACETGQ